jgi:predicted lysophospholipase L1 biosynthesis ABC-type transport system permease subunit
VIGTIGHAGLQGPSELAFYRGTDRMPPDARRIARFGSATPHLQLPPALLLLAVVALAALLMPVAVFIAAAARFGGEARDRRLAALRLVGADRAATVRVAAGEAALGAIAGLAVGALVFLAGRGLVAHVTLWDISVFSADVRPSAPLAVLVAVAVPLTAVAAAVLGLRQVVLEPLGVVRHAGARRRRLAWRVVPPALGVALLAQAGPGDENLAAAAVVLLLAGVATLLPWLVEAVVRRLGPGAVPWQLAIRRLQLDGGSSARVVSGIAVAVAGAIALQTLFSGVENEYSKSSGGTRAQATVEDRFGRPLGQLPQRLAAVPGVRAAVGVTIYDAVGTPRAVGDCAALRELARIGRCADGDAFSTDGPRAVASQPDPSGGQFGGLLLTPGAAARRPPKGPAHPVVYLRLDRRDPDAIERVRTAVALDTGLSVLQLGGIDRDRRFATLRRAVLAGAVATLLLVGASLLVSLLEQVRERRRLLATLAAFGTRRATLGWSVLWQAAVPVALGLALALAAGLGLGALLLDIVDEPRAFDWGAVAALSGAGAAVVLAVTALSLPPLWRVMRADGLRTE